MQNEETITETSTLSTVAAYVGIGALAAGTYIATSKVLRRRRQRRIEEITLAVQAAFQNATDSENDES
jgi:hypothetical protein